MIRVGKKQISVKLSKIYLLHQHNPYLKAQLFLLKLKQCYKKFLTQISRKFIFADRRIRQISQRYMNYMRMSEHLLLFLTGTEYGFLWDVLFARLKL